jgi:hypothetical protein
MLILLWLTYPYPDHWSEQVKLFLSSEPSLKNISNVSQLTKEIQNRQLRKNKVALKSWLNHQAK